MIIQELQLRNPRGRPRHGLSEHLARRYFLKQGYEVFRGTMILGREWSYNYDKYESVKQKYDRLELLLLKRLNLRLLNLRHELSGAAGIPDFFVHRRVDSFFAEIKLEHEQLKPHQLQCLKLLESYGFKVMVVRLKSKLYRVRSRVKLDDSLDISLKRREVLIRQEKIRYSKSKL